MATTSDDSLVTVGNLKQFTYKAGTSYTLSDCMQFSGARTITSATNNFWHLGDNIIPSDYLGYLQQLTSVMTNHTTDAKGCGNTLGLLAYNGNSNEYWPLQNVVFNGEHCELWFTLPPIFMVRKLFYFDDSENNYIPKLLVLSFDSESSSVDMLTPSGNFTNSSTLVFNGTVTADLTINGLLNCIIG